MKRRFIGIIIFIFIAGCKNQSEVIETLNGEEITVDRFEKAYEASLETISRLQNIEKKNLLEFLAKDIEEVPEQFKGLNYQFQKKNFYDNYRNMLMIKLAADKSGFTKRQDIKDILEIMELQAISQLYIQEQVERKIKISDEEAKEECERIRKQNPQIAALPIDRCIMLGRSNLKRLQSQEVIPKVMERIKEEVVIKHNEKFDLDAYLSSDKEKKKDKTP